MRKVFFIMGLIVVTNMLQAQDSLFTVTGQIQYEKEGALFLSLCSESQFMKKDVRPTNFIILEALPDSAGNRLVAFNLDSIPADEYVISIFQDVNGNGKIDMGFMGPKEPYGFSGPRPRFIPKFEKLKFDVKDDVENMIIKVK